MEENLNEISQFTASYANLVISEEAKEIFRNMTEEQLDEASRQFAAMMNYQFEKMITEQYLGQQFDEAEE